MSLVFLIFRDMTAMFLSATNRVLFLSAAFLALGMMMPQGAKAQTSDQPSQEQLQAKAYEDYMASLNAINASGGAGASGVPALPVPEIGLPGEKEEPEVIMTYDKKAVEGFYGVGLPERLFNNVPSDW